MNPSVPQTHRRTLWVSLGRIAVPRAPRQHEVGRCQADAQSPAPSPELAYLKQVNQWRPPTGPAASLSADGPVRQQRAATSRASRSSRMPLKQFGSSIERQRRRRNTCWPSRRCARGHANDVFSCSSASAGCATPIALLDDAKRLSTGRQDVRLALDVGRGPCAAARLSFASATRRSPTCNGASTTPPWPRIATGCARCMPSGRRLRVRAATALEAARYLALSGYTTESRPRSSPRRSDERVGGRHLRAASDSRGGEGHGLRAARASSSPSTTFVISADRRELIAIDAGTRPDSARAAARGAEGSRAVAAAADHRVGHPRPLGPRGRASLPFAA